jgi:hypothetical protein
LQDGQIKIDCWRKTLHDQVPHEMMPAQANQSLNEIIPAPARKSEVPVFVGVNDVCRASGKLFPISGGSKLAIRSQVLPQCL